MAESKLPDMHRYDAASHDGETPDDDGMDYEMPTQDSGVEEFIKSKDPDLLLIMVINQDDDLFDAILNNTAADELLESDPGDSLATARAKKLLIEYRVSLKQLPTEQQLMELVSGFRLTVLMGENTIQKDAQQRVVAVIQNTDYQQAIRKFRDSVRDFRMLPKHSHISSSSLGSLSEGEEMMADSDSIENLARELGLVDASEIAAAFQIVNKLMNQKKI